MLFYVILFRKKKWNNDAICLLFRMKQRKKIQQNNGSKPTNEHH